MVVSLLRTRVSLLIKMNTEVSYKYKHHLQSVPESAAGSRVWV